MDVPVRNTDKIFAYPPPPSCVESPFRRKLPDRPTLDDLFNSGLSSDDIKKIFYDRMDAFSTLILSEYIKGPHSKMHMYLYKIFREKMKTGAREVIIAPRSSAKSVVMTLALPLWVVCYRMHRFIIIVSDTQDQAEDFLSCIREELESNEVIRTLYPEAFGKGAVWRNDRIITKNDILIRAMGSGGKIRGRRYKNFRPSLICHEKGTPIFYKGKWIPIEDSPYEKSLRLEKGLEVSLWTLPFSETVTNEHLYWAKTVKFKINQWDTVVEGPASWIKACDLKKNSYIGTPINYEIREMHPIDIRKSGPGVILERDDKGRVKKAYGEKSFYVKEIPDTFYDPEFWWFVGLWWGDGHAGINTKNGACSLNVSICHKDTHILERLNRFAEKYGKHVSLCDRETYNGGACWQVSISWPDIVRWFVSEWIQGNSKKIPPYWIELLDPKYQKELIHGYLDADGFIDKKGKSIRLTSIYLEGLLCVRRILARLGIPSSIRKGVGKSVDWINDRLCNRQQKYDLRFRTGCSVLGYDIPEPQRYSYGRVFIKDGFLWTRVREVKETKVEKVFVPITTPSHKYITHFGLSHNCGDDLENKQMIDSDTLRRGLITWFDQDVCKAGARAQDVDIFVAGTILHRESLLNQLYEGKKYAGWSSRRFQAIESWCTNTEGQKYWGEWKKKLINRYDPLREYEAMRFFLLHQDVMLEGTKILWDDWDTYYSLMYEMITDGELAFYREKQNIPQSPDEQIFKGLIYYTEKEFSELKGTFQYSLYLDSSIGRQTKKHDFSAITVLAKHLNTGISFVRQCAVERIPVSKQVENIVNTVLALNSLGIYPKIGIESNAFQTILGDQIKETLLKQGARYEKLIEIHHSVDKTSRIESLEPFVKNGLIRFREGEDQELIGELEWYSPSQSHDDALDSLEGAYSMLNAKVFVPTFARTNNLEILGKYIVSDTYKQRKKHKFTYD